jgi:hypothetical protein
VAGFPHPDFFQGQSVAVFYHQQAIGDAIAQQFLEGVGHGRNRLAGADHEDTVAGPQILAPPLYRQRVFFEPKVPSDSFFRVNRRQRGPENGHGIPPQAEQGRFLLFHCYFFPFEALAEPSARQNFDRTWKFLPPIRLAIIEMVRGKTPGYRINN